jgi:hypothetical protein
MDAGKLREEEGTYSVKRYFMTRYGLDYEKVSNIPTREQAEKIRQLYIESPLSEAVDLLQEGDSEILLKRTGKGGIYGWGAPERLSHIELWRFAPENSVSHLSKQELEALTGTEITVAYESNEISPYQIPNNTIEGTFYHVAELDVNWVFIELVWEKGEPADWYGFELENPKIANIYHRDGAISVGHTLKEAINNAIDRYALSFEMGIEIKRRFGTYKEPIGIER